VAERGLVATGTFGFELAEAAAMLGVVFAVDDEGTPFDVGTRSSAFSLAFDGEVLSNSSSSSSSSSSKSSEP
jgi:hypothetical protein